MNNIRSACVVFLFFALGFNLNAQTDSVQWSFELKETYVRYYLHSQKPLDTFASHCHTVIGYLNNKLAVYQADTSRLNEKFFYEDDFIGVNHSNKKFADANSGCDGIPLYTGFNMIHEFIRNNSLLNKLIRNEVLHDSLYRIKISTQNNYKVFTVFHTKTFQLQKDSVFSKYYFLDNKIDSMILDVRFQKTNVGMKYHYKILHSELPNKSLQQISDRLKGYKNTYEFAQQKSTLADSTKPKIDSVFVLPSLSGLLLDIKNNVKTDTTYLFSVQPKFIVFFFVGCLPCNALIKDIKKLVADSLLADSDVLLVNVVDKDTSRVIKYLSLGSVNFETIITDKKTLPFNPKGFPIAIIADKNKAELVFKGYDATSFENLKALVKQKI